MSSTQVSAHGTGASIPTVDEQVVSLKLVTPGRGTIQLSEQQDPHLFRLAKVGLGLLGVVAEVTLQCVDAHSLLEHTFVTTARVRAPLYLLSSAPFQHPLFFLMTLCRTSEAWTYCSFYSQCLSTGRLLQEVKRNHRKWLAENRHVKYLWIPYTDAVVVVKNNPVAEVQVPHKHCIAIVQ